ncbi:MAG: phosphate regulon sensor histidine kinase PhoR [Sutterellaceae bacterium]|nr:phosphate regulon sensor histidine kinase PhoR [Burkholderiaceae bacterium]MCX7901748.1 phosphate regulon sensor histidine kinase PhoR [Burkholderiaceae bacterium]MDW8430454.1 phosphate regulon sensor histidine kinase PhoR [Sutterellaceae bacterium]
MGERFRERLRIVAPALLRLALVGAAALIVGYFLGDRVGLWFALIGFGAALAFHLFYLSALGAWLARPSLETVPEGVGTWATVFSRLYKSRRASELNERRLADNEARFRRTISALPEGLVLVDAQLQIEWCNPVAERHFGIRLSADAGLRLTNLVRDPVFVAYFTSAAFDAPLTFKPLANPGLVLSVQVIEFEPQRMIVLTRDVTQSERVDAMRRDFIANVSHELRTPLTVISGFLETLLEGAPPLDETRVHHLRLMYEQAQRMNRLVGDLLMLSRLESQEQPPADETVDIVQLVHEIADEARVLSGGRHRILVDCAQLSVRGSREELRSAFSNLVSNAIRYTPDGGRISLRWRATSAGAAFEVEDTGIGIAPEHIPRLTERFYRVDKSRSRETGGTGLGLAIVKHVLARHQGQLVIESAVGRGSTFAAHLPRERIIEGAESQLRAA